MRSLGYALTVLGIGAALIAGCGGDDGDDGGAAAKGKQSATAPISPDAADSATGKVTVCLPKDVSGAFHKTIEAFNQESEVQAALLELPESADQQRNQLITRAQSKSAECDVIGIDVIWTAEFANEGWVKDLSQVVEQRKAEFIASTLETGKYDGKYWALPHNSNAALLYYRTDAVKDAPATWEDTYKLAAEHDGLVYQGAAYEGLTCDFLELLYSAGGQVVSEDGKASAIDADSTRQVLDFMVAGVKDGTAPKGVTTFMEEQSRRLFESGRVTFMRNWPYAYALGNKAPKIKGKFAITTLPGFAGNPGVGVLGGTNLAISAYSKNPGGALALMNFFTGDVGQRLIGEGATPPATIAAYDVKSVRKAIGLPDEIRDAVGKAMPRPVSPVYPQISQAIYKSVNKALAGELSTDDAVASMHSDIEKALATF
jgi:multiple sugar transport system substrate-binding protein